MRSPESGSTNLNRECAQGWLALLSPLVSEILNLTETAQYAKLLKNWPIPEALEEMKSKLKRFVKGVSLTPDLSGAGLENMQDFPIDLAKDYEGYSKVGRGLSWCCWNLKIVQTNHPEKMNQPDFRKIISQRIAESLGINGKNQILDGMKLSRYFEQSPISEYAGQYSAIADLARLAVHNMHQIDLKKVEKFVDMAYIDHGQEKFSELSLPRQVIIVDFLHGEPNPSVKFL